MRGFKEVLSMVVIYLSPGVGQFKPLGLDWQDLIRGC